MCAKIKDIDMLFDDSYFHINSHHLQTSHHKKSQNPSPPPTVEARRVRGRERETLDQGGSGLRGDLRCLGGNHGGDVGTYC